MKEKFTIMLALFMFVCVQAYSQTEVSGTVKDDDGETLPGVTVQVKNTTRGVVTSIDGTYSLSVESGETLVFSSVGLKQKEVLYNGESVLNIVLEANILGLDDVVVIAYGATEKRKFTGSLSTVEAKDLNQVPQTSPIQMIQGRSAGVLVEDNNGAPGSVGSILIRGVGSYGNNGPLYVIDGLPASNFQSFNPNDIESISILKDAAATSIYGSRASNGVVLITTKKGKTGKTKITLNAQSGFSNIENPNDFRLMNATEYTEYYREAFSNAGLDEDVMMPANSDSINTNWLDDVMRTGKTQLYEITASGGSENATHYISAGYFKQQGVVIGTDYERYTGRVNLNLAPTNKLNIFFGILGSFANNDLQYQDGGRSGIYSGSFNVAPTASPFATDLTPLNLNGLGYNFNLPSNAGHNPIAANALNTRMVQTYRALPTAKVTVEPINNLSLSASASLDFAVSKGNSFQSKYYYAESDNGLAEVETEYGINTNINFTAKYDLNIGSDHVISPMIGTERFKSSSESESAESSEFGFDGIPIVGAGSILRDISSDYTAHTLVSVFSRVNYTFREKLFLDLSYRSDGSSRFGPENRWGSFYSIGAGYDLTNESFLQAIGALSFLRLRGSYGIQGNYAIGDYQWRNTYNSEGAFIVPGGGNSGAQPESPGNPGLQWEESVSANVGLDFGILQNKLTGTVEYYSRGSDALLGAREISRTSGFSSFVDNIGDIRNKGLEISLSSTNIETSDFTWKTDFNITFNKSEIIQLNADSDTTSTSTTANIKGQPFEQWYLPQYAGVDPGTGLPLYRTLEGTLTFDENLSERQVSGKTSLNPDFYGGFVNSFSYKGLTLSAMFYFKYGFKIYNDLKQQISVPGRNNNTAANLDRWQQPGDVTSVPKVDFNDQSSAQFNSTRWLEDGSYIRLRNVSLSYLVPSVLTEKVGVADLTLSIRSVNLLTFTEFSGFDPGVGSVSEDDDYPVNRTITFGLSATF